MTHEDVGAAGVVVPPPNRAIGLLRARFVRAGARTQVERVYEAGGLRLRFPNVLRGTRPDCEAVCINTGGGMVGGDGAQLAFDLADGAAVTLTTQSAEKIYRAEGTPTTVDVALKLCAGAQAEWLPQETILFDRIDLRRRLEIDMTADATLLLAETLVFGRLAMGETVRTGSVRDQWRIRRAGRLVFAEAFRVAGEVAAILDRPATGAGARALTTLVFVAPDAEARLDAVRDALAGSAAHAGASAWNGLLCLRAAAPSPDLLRPTILAVLRVLRGTAAPRVWQ